MGIGVGRTRDHDVGRVVENSRRDEFSANCVSVCIIIDEINGIPTGVYGGNAHTGDDDQPW